MSGRAEFGACLGAVAALVLIPATFSLDGVAREGQLGPGFWPRLILVGLALACAGRAAMEWRRGARRLPSEAPSPIAVPTLVAAVTLIVLYVLAPPAVGFPVATAVFVAVFMWLAGSRSAVTLAGCALGGTIVLLYIFVKVVYLPLPKGAGPFEHLTLALYRALGIF